MSHSPFLRIPLRVVLAMALAATSAGCHQLVPGRDAADPNGAPTAEVQALRARERALLDELARLRNELALRDTVAPAVATENARIARAFEAEHERAAELTSRLQASTATIERLAADNAALTRALAEARARLEERERETPPAEDATRSAPSPEPPREIPVPLEPPPVAAVDE